MISIQINDTPHDFEKENLVTARDRLGNYDSMKCTKCGIKGKRRQLDTVDVKGSYSKEKIYNCTGEYLEETERPKKIKITHCTAYGDHFTNLTPGSEHTVVDPAEGYSEDDKGVWVIGATGEPVKVLNNEFETIE